MVLKPVCWYNFSSLFSLGATWFCNTTLLYLFVSCLDIQLHEGMPATFSQSDSPPLSRLQRKDTTNNYA